VVALEATQSKSDFKASWVTRRAVVKKIAPRNKPRGKDLIKSMALKI